jgi:hypothetical protein
LLIGSTAGALAACGSTPMDEQREATPDTGIEDGVPDASADSGADGHGACAEEGARRCWDNTPQLCAGAVWRDEPACTGDRSACMAGVCQAAVVDVSVGSYHTCALRSTGQVKCWGSSQDGIGLGDNIDRRAATLVTRSRPALLQESCGASKDGRPPRTSGPGRNVRGVTQALPEFANVCAQRGLRFCGRAGTGLSTQPPL